MPPQPPPPPPLMCCRPSYPSNTREVITCLMGWDLSSGRWCCSGCPCSWFLIFPTLVQLPYLPSIRKDIRCKMNSCQNPRARGAESPPGSSSQEGFTSTPRTIPGSGSFCLYFLSSHSFLFSPSLSFSIFPFLQVSHTFHFCLI